MMASRILQDLLAMSQSVGLSKATVVAYLLPPFVCQYVMGVLVQLEGTRAYRLALLPIMLCLAWRATFVDMSGGDPKKAQANEMLVTQMASMATRSAVWGVTRLRYQRRDPETDRPGKGGIWSACWHTWDLLLGPRGIGWNWPRGLVVPTPSFATDSRVVFVAASAAACACHVVGFDACVQAIRVLSPATFGSLRGGTLFDHALPPALEAARAVWVAFLAAASAYFGVQYTYHVLAIVCVVVFRQRPSQWPPIFDAPWRSTSLSALWGRRWHQLMRDMLLTLGYAPCRCVAGPLGGLVGAFLVSGLFHDVELGRRGYTAVVVGFWVMNGVGVVLERVWTRATGKRVGGVLGWTWTVVWLAVWGVPMANVYAKVGRFGGLEVVGGFEPSLALAGFVRSRWAGM